MKKIIILLICFMGLLAVKVMADTPVPTATFTFTVSPTATSTITPTKIVSSCYSNQNLFRTEIKGSYTNTSITVVTHNWNKSSDSYEVYAQESTGNTYTSIRRYKETNDVIFYVADLAGNTITGNFDYLIKQ